MLVQTKPNGTWWIDGVSFEEVRKINPELYGALCKLRDYEARDFEPDDLDVVIENIHIGSVKDGYTVFGVWNDYCIAIKNLSRYAVMRIGEDGFDIIWRKCFNNRIEAGKFFFECASSNRITITEYWKR